jgi:predicted aldo/keto reductase-like oxidoreductase
MKRAYLSRREFLQRAGLATGALLVGASSVPVLAQGQPKRTATDQVSLGKTGLKLSRLGFGTGSNNGQALKALGKEAFTKLIRYAYDQGITYFDCAADYMTYDMLGEAIKGLPREKLFIQSKIHKPRGELEFLQAIDTQRSTYQTDYVDSLLIHQMTPDTDSFKRMMDAFDEAREKKWIKAKGASVHTLPALTAAVKSDFPAVHLVRINPQGAFMDGQRDGWGRRGTDINPVLAEIKTMHEKGRGVIGMKIFGNGSFTDPTDREKSVRFAMSQPEIGAVVIGFKSNEEIDDTLKLINTALAA